MSGRSPCAARDNPGPICPPWRPPLRWQRGGRMGGLMLSNRASGRGADGGGREGVSLSQQLALLCAAGAILCAGCDRADQAPPPPPLVEVVVTQVTQRDVPISGEWLGTTDGTVNAEVRSRVQGYLMEQHYTEGAVVKKGDKLYKVDPRPFEATLAQARADLARAQAEQGKSELEVNRLIPLAPSG